MLRYASNYILKSKHISPVFLKSYCNSKFSNEYMKNVKNNLTDFQNTFGFDESLKEMREESVLRTKKSVRVMSYMGVVLCSIGITLSFFFNCSGLYMFLVSFDRKGSIRAKKIYFTQSTNLKIRSADFLPRTKANKKVISYIKTYVERMKENELVNSIYNCILLNNLDKVVKHIVNEVSETKIYNKEQKDFNKEIMDVLYLTSEMLNVMDPKYHPKQLLEASVSANNILNQILSNDILPKDLQKEQNYFPKIIQVLIQHTEGIRNITDFVANTRQLLEKGYLKAEDIDLQGFYDLTLKMRETSEDVFKTKKSIAEIEEFLPSKIYDFSQSKQKYYNQIYSNFISESIFILDCLKSNKNVKDNSEEIKKKIHKELLNIYQKSSNIKDVSK